MLIQTARFGELEVRKENSVIFKQPIFGFETYDRFVRISQENSPFEFLQSVEDEHLTFVIADPFLFVQKYEFTLERRWLDLLQIENEKQVIIRSIITVRSPSDITINLKAPIIINSATRESAQIILDQPEYSTRHSILQSSEGETSDVDSLKK